MVESELPTSPRPTSTVFIFWPWQEAPSDVEVRLRLEQAFESRGGRAVEVEAEPYEGSSDVLWLCTCSPGDAGPPLLIWASSVDEPPSADDLSEARFRDDERDRALATRWVVGIDTLLDPEDPLGSYHRQLRVARELAPESPGLYDADSGVLRSGSEVELLTSTAIPPRTTELYSVHAVRDDAGSPELWLHTQGLHRAEFPEIEVRGVPEELQDAGVYLIRTLIDRFLGDEPPPTAVPVEIGYRLQVACVEPPDRPTTSEEERGRRLVVVDAKPRGLIRKRWHPPIAALRRIDEEGAVACVSRTETDRMARLARERWADFGMLFAKHRKEADWLFLVKLGYAIDDGEPDEREHLWFQVGEIVPDRIRAKLLNRPLRVSRLTERKDAWHRLERLTDWKIYSPAGEFTPENVGQLEEPPRFD